MFRMFGKPHGYGHSFVTISVFYAAVSLLLSSSAAVPSYKNTLVKRTDVCQYVAPNNNNFSDAVDFGDSGNLKAFFLSSLICNDITYGTESGQDLLSSSNDLCNTLPLDPTKNYGYVATQFDIGEILMAMGQLPFLPSIVRLGPTLLSDIIPNITAIAFCFAQYPSSGTATTFALQFSPGIPPHGVFQDAKTQKYKIPVVPAIEALGFSNDDTLVFNRTQLTLWNGLSPDGIIQVPPIKGNFWLRADILFPIEESPLVVDLNADLFMGFESNSNGIVEDVLIDINSLTLDITVKTGIDVKGLRSVNVPILDLGNGFALQRTQTDQTAEICNPSGIFVVVNEDQKLPLIGGLIDKYLGDTGPTQRIDASIYFNPNPGFANEPTAINFRYAKSFNLLGYSLAGVTFEFAYASPTEIQRRQNFVKISNGCVQCKNIGSGGVCQDPTDPLDTWIQQQGTSDYLIAGYIDLHSSLTPIWGTGFVSLHEFFVLAAFDVAGTDAGDFILYFGGKISVLIIIELDVYVVITDTEFLFHIEFSSEFFIATIDGSAIGVGYLPTNESSITNNKRDYDDHNALVKRDSTFLDADWSVSISFAPGPWLNDLISVVNEAVTVVSDFAEDVWSDVTTFVTNLGQDIYSFFAPGGELEQIGDAIKSQFEDWANDLARIADKIYDFLNNVLGTLGNTFPGLADSIHDIIQAGEDLANGDFKGFFGSLGSAVTDLFEGTEDDHWQLLSTNDSLGCPQYQHQWKTCDRIFGIDVSCSWHYGDTQSDSTCLMKKSQAINTVMGKASIQNSTNTQLDNSTANNAGLQLVKSNNKILANNPPTVYNTSTNVTADTVQSAKFNIQLTIIPLSTTSNTTLAPPANLSIPFNNPNLQTDNATFGQAFKDFFYSHNITISNAILNGNMGPTPNLTALSIPRQKPNITRVPPDMTIDCNKFLQILNSTVQDVLNITAKAEYDPNCTPGPILSIVGKNTSPDQNVNCATDAQIGWYTSDSCTGNSAIVYQNLIITPIAPTFSSLPPQNITITCEQATDPSANGGSPVVIPSCGGTGYSLDFNDTSIVETSCGVWSFTRTWTASTGGCSNLAITYSQTFTIIDKIAPYWDESTFPSDKSVDFLQPYGTLQMGVPTSYDSCGEAPITINYTDSYASSGTCSAEKVITRTWFTSDKCGNSRSQNQIITVTNKNRQLSDGSLFQVYASSTIQVSEANFEGQIAGISSIKGSGLNIGYGGTCDFGPDSVACNTASITIPQSHVYNGLSKANAGLDTTDTSKQAKNLTTFLKNLKNLQDGNIAFTCSNNVLNTTKATSYLNANCTEIGNTAFTCAGNPYNTTKTIGPANYISANCTPTSSIAWSYLTPTTSGNTITLKGADPIYNIFNIPSGTLNSASKHLIVDVPAQALVLVNAPDDRAPIGFASITFTNGNSESNLLFSLSSATTLQPIANSIFGGTIIAPSAAFQFTSTGVFTMTGQLFVLSYNAQTVIHKCAPFHGLRFCSDKGKSPVSVPGLLNASTITSKSTSTLSLLTQAGTRSVASSSSTGRPVITNNVKSTSSMATAKPKNASIASGKTSSTTSTTSKTTSKGTSTTSKATPKGASTSSKGVKVTSSAKGVLAKVTSASTRTTKSTATSSVKKLVKKPTSSSKKSAKKPTSSVKKP